MIPRSTQCPNLSNCDFSSAKFEVSLFLKINLVTLLTIQNKLVLRSLKVCTIAAFSLMISPVITGDQGDPAAPGRMPERERSRASLGKTHALGASSVQLATRPATLHGSFTLYSSFPYLRNGDNNYHPPIRCAMLINCEAEYEIKAALL